MIVGVPGVLLALLVRFTMAEPIRGLNEKRKVQAGNVPIKTVIALLWQRRSFRHMAMGAAMNAFAGYSVANWVASYMIRSYQMPTGELGTWLALVIGVGGAIGVFGSGVIADRLGKRDKRWYMWMPAVACLISFPFQFGIYLTSDPYFALMMLVIGFLGLWLVVKKLHERTLLSISTSRKTMDWSRSLFAFSVWAGITVVIILLDYVLSPEDYKWNFNPQQFIILFIVATLLIPIQTSMEEYVFRGY